MVEMVPGEKSVDKQTHSPKRSNRRVNMNTADESVIRELPGVNFIEARRICVERPFENEAELLKTMHVAIVTFRWDAGGIEIAFDDPFLTYEKVQQVSSTVVMPSPSPIVPPPAPSISPSPIMPSPAPSNYSQPTPSSRRPPRPRPRASHDSPGNSGLPPSGLKRQKGQERIVGSSPRIGATPQRNDSDITASSPAVEKLVELVYRQQDARLRRIAVSRMARTITLVITAWRDRILDRRRWDEMEFGLILRRLRGSLLGTLSSWCAFAKKCSRLRKLGVSMLLRVLARYRASAFRHWHAVLDGMSAMGVVYANLLARCFTRCLADHYEAWRDHAHSNVYQSHIMLRAISGLLHVCLRSAWNAWGECCRNRKQLRKIGLTALFRWLNVRVGLMFQAWWERAALAEAVATMRVRSEAVRTAECLHGCMGHWRYMASKESIQNVKKKIIMTLRGALVESFISWHEHVVTTRRWATALSRAMAKIERRISYRTFYLWVWRWQRNIQLHETGICVLVSSMERHLRLIFEGWQNISMRSRLWLHVHRKVMKIDSKTLYTQHFNAWRSSVGNRIRELRQLCDGWKEYKNPAGREGALMVRVLYGWSAIAKSGLQLRRAGVKVLLRWLTCGVRQIFQRWKIGACADRKHDNDVRKIEATHARTLQQRALAAWAGARVHAVSWSNVVLNIGLRWMTAELSSIFRHWRNTAKLLRSREIHYERARRRVIRSCKRATIFEWSVYTYEARRLWHAGSVILSRWTMSVLARSLSCWILHVVEAKEKMTRLKISVARMCCRDTEYAFAAWHQAAHARENTNLPADYQYASSSSLGTLGTSSHLALDSHRQAPSSSRSPTHSIYASSHSGSCRPDAVDTWSRVLASLSANQRMGIHLLAMQRTWEIVSSSFAGWASLRDPAARQPRGAPPPEPDEPPQLSVEFGELAQRPPGHSYMPPELYSTSLSHHSPSAPWKHAAPSRRPSSDEHVPQQHAPAAYTFSPQPPMSIHSASHSPRSPRVPVVVMSNFPRQQFTPASSQKDELASPPPSPSATCPPSPSAAASPLHPFMSNTSSVALPRYLSPRTVQLSPRMIMSPHSTHSIYSSGLSRQSWDEKGVKLGLPVTQSLTPGRHP